MPVPSETKKTVRVCMGKVRSLQRQGQVQLATPTIPLIIRIPAP
jgi:hypothetical protein